MNESSSLDKFSAIGINSVNTARAFLAIYRSGDEGLQPTEIANQLGVSTPALTGIIDKLSKARLVERQEVKDRRAVKIIATEAGVKFGEALR